MKIQYKTKNVYGNTMFYPVNDLAIGIADILNQSTLTESQLIKLEKLGFQLEQIHDTHKLGGV